MACYKMDHTPLLLGAVPCPGAGRGLRGTILRRREAQLKPHSISSLEEISKGRLGGSVS